MKAGDLVMFTDNGIYAKYFFGAFAEVVSSSVNENTNNEHVRVRWQQPVKYGNTMTHISDFASSRFTLIHTS
jgi:acyl-ACP thioesterase